MMRALRPTFLACVALSVPLAFIATAGAQPAGAQPAISAEQRKAAMETFDKGSQAFAEKRYKDAIDLFLEADTIVKNADLAYNTSLAYEAMGDVAAALRWAREYLRRAPAAADRADVEKRISTFESRLQAKGIQQATILSQPAGATVLVDGSPVGVTPWTGELRPGRHEVELRLRDYGDERQTFELRPDRALEISLELQPGASTPPPSQPSPDGPQPKKPTRLEYPPERPALLIAGGTALGLGVGGLFAALGLELARASAEDDAVAAPRQVEAVEHLDRMEGYQLGARVAVGVGAGLAVLGGTLLGVGLGMQEQEVEVTVGSVAGFDQSLGLGIRRAF